MKKFQTRGETDKEILDYSKNKTKRGYTKGLNPLDFTPVKEGSPVTLSLPALSD